MLMFFRPSPSGNISLARIVRRIVIHRKWLSTLIAALAAAVCLTACGPSSSDKPSSPSGTESTGVSTSTDPYTDPYTSTDQTTTDQTDPCAFAGDPLCPDTAITIPPPDIGNWP